MDPLEQSYRRILFIIGLVFCASLILLIQLIRIQVVEHRHYSQLTVQQRSRYLLTNPLRGAFYDRNGRSLRGADRAWYIMIQNPLRDAMAERLAAIFGPDFQTERERQRHAGRWVYPKPLKASQVRSLERFKSQEWQIIANPAAPQATKLAWHALGSVRDGKGVSGLESLYDSFLTASRSTASLVAFVDGKHHPFQGLGIRNLRKSSSESGVILTLDERIQRIAEAVMDRERLKGAIVVLDVNSGQILAMASRPMVNFANLQESLSDPNNPFLNRAIAAYNPGSIFKLVTLCAGIDGGLLNPNEVFTAYSYPDMARWHFPTGDVGRLSLTEALAYSYNPIFIEIALRLGPEIILQYGDRLGLAQPCNIGLKDEAWGELPSGLGMSPGEQANMALGQQGVMTTPLQVASLVQTIANGGIRNIPRLVLGTKDGENSEIKWLEPQPPVRVLKPETTAIIRRMMKAVVDFGTGKEAALYGGEAAGKTGTAQTGEDGYATDNAWFAGFAPYSKPRYVTVVFCEQGGAGGKAAAPIFREIMEKVTKIRD